MVDFFNENVKIFKNTSRLSFIRTTKDPSAFTQSENVKRSVKLDN